MAISGGKLSQKFWLVEQELFMNEDMVLNIGAEAIKITMMLAGPMLVAAMLVGIVVSVLQAITQINEATLTFIPKMIAVILVIVVLAPWMLKIMEEYAVSIYGNMNDWIR